MLWIPPNLKIQNLNEMGAKKKMKKSYILKSVAGAMAFIMSFYSILPIRAVATDDFKKAVAENVIQINDSTSEMHFEDQVDAEQTAAESTQALEEETIPQESIAHEEIEMPNGILPPEVDEKPETSQSDSKKEEDVTPESTAVPESTQRSEPLLSHDELTVDGVAKPVYQDGTILIYDFEQLQLLGTNAPVKSLENGEMVLDSSGNPVSYRLDASYALANEIALPQGTIWQLPEGFAGRIAPLDATAGMEKTLYAQQTDTIYLYHSYQLEVMAMENATDQPVLSGDADAQTFGTGQLIYPKGESEPFLTYGQEHRYVLSPQFCSDQVEKPDAEFYASPTGDGRDFEGQIIKTVNGKDYILIGNADQLRAIGSDKPVMGEVYQAYQSKLKWFVDEGADGKPILLYSGDADLLQSQNGKKDYAFGTPDATDKNLSNKGGIKGRCAVDPKTGVIDPKLDIETLGKTYKYSNKANYIIFRDIDLANAKWEPLEFSGNMIGAKSTNGEKLWDETGTNITSTQRPVISNIRISQDKPRKSDETMGIGFFSTIESKPMLIGSSLASPDQVVVQNLILSEISVTNIQTKVNNDPSILGTLVGGLGTIVGGLLDIVLGILGIHTNLNKILGALLNARTVEKSFYATGAFAGRIIGNTAVSNCEVRNVQVSNATDFTGGFVGYTEGTPRYLLEAVGRVLELLTKILNAIPWLGLGDLVNVVLQLLSVDKLVAVGYDNPVITDCMVTGLSGTLGKSAPAPAAIGGQKLEGGSYAGGFAGAQIGAQIIGCTVKDSTYTILTDEYGGGFAGITRDGEISGVLKDVGLELLKEIQPQSLLMECQILNSNVTVNGGSYLGGFTGALASSYAVNDTITGTLRVSGNGSYAGGFAGTATLGWASNLGAEEVKKENLLSTVKALLLSLIGSPNSNALLSLVGLSPSAILGVQMNCTDIQVSADKNYAGGILGRGDGAYLTGTAAYKELPAWKHGRFPAPQDTARSCSVTGLHSVHAGGSYAGGAVGSMVPASAAGVLDGTLGLANMIAFTISDLALSGNNFSVTAGGKYAGGMIGEAVGGKIEKVAVSNISKVEAQSRVGGFAGIAGPGDLAGSNGLELKLLGIPLLSIKNLLAVGQGIRVTGKNCTVDGADTGLTVTALGSNEQGSIEQFTAAGFIAKSNSTEFTNCHVKNLLSVVAPEQNGYAGGFVGTSESGGLAEVGEEGGIKELISLGNLVSAVGYLIPKYTNCTVVYSNGGGVQGDVAGGFAADFRSGKVDNTSRGESDPYAVYNIDYVNGQRYAGGFGGRVTSGALAQAGGGLSILGGITGVSINISDLLSVVEAYVPYVTKAGVRSSGGFTVSAPAIRETDANSGSAGGFIGYASGAQISHSDVNRLKHTKVTPPDNLEAVEATSYFDGSSSYAVHGERYAGGYVGHLDIGSAASLGSGLKILGKTIQLTNILDALSVVVSTVEHSSVIGSPGGFAILGDHSGGFTGMISGGHVQNCHAKNFSYIIGHSTAGGYVGNLVPGNVANVLENTSILGGLVSGDEALASLAEDFVPTIRNSTASGIPCGGAVRAHDPSTPQLQKGSAGGYVGLNEGGQIRGNDTSRWKKDKPYTGPQHECKVERIDSIYGYEYAGGFTGLMRSADTVRAGGLKLLGGIIEIGNILGALSITYPTQTNTATYGPLANLDYETWNAWVEYVGKYGGRGAELAAIGPVQDQAQLDAILKDFVYGYTVAAGRLTHDAAAISEGASAGGYVGTMISGVITNGQAHDVKAVKAMGNAGGYAGKMRAGGAAEFGTVKILGLKLNLGQLLQAAQFFVPVIKGSSVEGYRSGLTVTATGKDAARNLGNAGGYVGSAYGAQIWGDKPNTDSGCDVLKLQRVAGNHTAGGYAGFVTAGAVAKVNTNMADGFLQSVLDHIIGNLGDLVSVMKATVSTIRGARITPADTEFGFVVGGDADYSGGFGGWMEAAIIGSSKNESKITVEGLRYVEGGLYSGGFFGLADVTGVAQVGGNGTEGGKTNIIELIQAGKVDVIDAFRTFVYHADVHGVEEGLTVLATCSDSTGMLDSKRHMGSAGGFGGGMMNGSIHDCTVTNLNTVQGLNYVGGFVGHLGKNGVVKADDASVHDLIGLTAGVLNVFGAHTENCSVSGIPSGFEIRAIGGETPMAGGFSGYADLSRIKNSTATNLKKVVSSQIAGGFVGKTDMGYLVEAKVDSALVDLVLKIVNELVKLLYLDKVQDVNLITIQLPPPLNKLLELQVMGDGNLIYVNLLGLKISVSLSKAEPDKPDQTDTVIVTIGDSKISLPCSKNGIDTDGKHPEIEIALIKGNRTKIENSSVSGISLGYDVYGGGAGDQQDGTHADGYAGGFVGLNHEGMLIGNQMYWCDVIRGTPEKVGPFTGTTKLDSVYDFNTIKSIEGDGNVYRIYRPQEDALPKAMTQNGKLIADAVTDDTYQMVFNRFDVLHLAVIEKFKNFENAVMTDGSNSLPLGVYVSSAKAVLMRDTNLSDNHNGVTPEPGESPDPCEQGMGLTITKVWKDWYNPSIRPESITVEIWQSYTDGQGTKHDALYQTLILSKADAEKETETWKKVVADLPVAKRETVDGQEVIYYYQYSVKEVPVPGYSSHVSTDKTGQIIITNKAAWPELPHTGGIGDWWFIIIGGVVVVLGCTRKKRKVRGKHLRRKTNNINR